MIPHRTLSTTSVSSLTQYHSKWHFLQSAALLFPQGPQMLALLSPPSPSFHPDNICTAVLSAKTLQLALELLTARGRSAQMARGGVRGLAPGG